MNDADILWASKHIIAQLTKFGVKTGPLQPNMETQLVNSTVIAWKNRIEEAEADARAIERHKSEESVAEEPPRDWEQHGGGFTTGGD